MSRTHRKTTNLSPGTFSLSKPWPILPSYLPWSLNPNVPFRSCESYFGNGFTRRIDLLKSSLFTFSSYPFRRNPIKAPQTPLFVESKLHISPTLTNSIPRLAYLISGSKSDGESLKRTLKALYHPLNQYVVHLDLEASAEERLELVDFVNNEGLFQRVGNVRVVVRSNLITYTGPTMVSNTLHAAAILLKEGGEWDWFINLSASDYPLVTQDDMLESVDVFILSPPSAN